MSIIDDLGGKPGPATGASGKVDMETAGYRSAGDDGRSCSGCGSFQAPDQCLLVNGTISPGGVCDLFAAKQDEKALMDQMFGGPTSV